MGEGKHSQALMGIPDLDLSNVRTSAQASQLLADFGADVVLVKSRGGSPLRTQAAWPFWARGKRTVQLDLHVPEDGGDRAQSLVDLCVDKRLRA
jgi:crotonobetainyl-CoA:carnitine CoA-transferase CaiB-like acyl-CoA transferase